MKAKREPFSMVPYYGNGLDAILPMKTTIQPCKFEKLWPGILLITLISVAYARVFTAGFMSWDDMDYVVKNSDIHGFEWEHIENWFTRFYIGNYHPITIFSYALDWAIGGKEPFIYHATSIVLHGLNALLVHRIVSTVTENHLVGVLTALLFAVHPCQTESVSWIAERKNVLYGLFFLLAILQYLQWLRFEKRRYLLAVYVLAVASLLSKGTAVALPLALFAVDVWMGKSSFSRKMLLAKAPLFVLSLIFGLVAIKAQEQGDFLNLNPHENVWQMLSDACVAYWSYVFRLFFPIKLSVLYPNAGQPVLLQFLSVVGIVSLIVLCFRLAKRKERILLGGILFFSANIIFLLQLIQFGKVLTADRYVYIPCIGLWVPVVFYLMKWLGARVRPALATGLITAVCLLFTVQTFSRNTIWLSELNFWLAIVDTFPKSAVGHYSLGGVYMSTGEYDKALSSVDRALALDSANHRAWYNKALIYKNTGHTAEALQCLDKSIAIANYAKALLTRAIMYESMGKVYEAYADCEQLVAQEPNNDRAHFLRGTLLEQMGKQSLALQAFDDAIRINEQVPMYFRQRGILLERMKVLDKSLEDLNHAIELNSIDGQAYYFRGMLRRELGQSPCEDLQTAKDLQFGPAAQALMDLCKKH